MAKQLHSYSETKLKLLLTVGKMRAPCLRKTFVVLTLVFVVSSFMAYYICTSLHLRLIFSANLSKKSTVEETTEPAEKSKNHLDEFEVYLIIIIIIYIYIAQTSI